MFLKDRMELIFIFLITSCSLIVHSRSRHITIQGEHRHLHGDGGQRTKRDKPNLSYKLEEPIRHNDTTKFLYSQIEGGNNSPKDLSIKPQINRVLCSPKNKELFIEWNYNYVPVSFFLLKVIPGDSSNPIEFIIPANLDSNSNRQQTILQNFTSSPSYDLQVKAIDELKKDVSDWSLPKPILCDDATNAATKKTNENGDPDILLITLLIVSVSFLVIITGVLVWRRWWRGSYYYLENPSPVGFCTNNGGGWEGETNGSVDDESGSSSSCRAPIPIPLFPEHVTELHRDGDIGFSKEYDSILSSEEEFSAVHSANPENKCKNRYLNILAYDHTRVRLENGSKFGSDYINGNFIDGFRKKSAYIGTQGPLPTTFDAFWQLVWESNVFVIIMITNLTERGRKKCDQYWPSSEIPETYGLIRVSLVREEKMATYILRTFKVSVLKGRGRRSVKLDDRIVLQYQYTVWPDHGTPSHPLLVLSFVRKSSASNPENGGPIIVHCSAGVGRTGTYIVLDAMLRQMSARGDLNIYGFLRHIRTQRNFLVQTEEQYIFCHDALLEAIYSGETNVTLSNLPQYLERLRQHTFTRLNGETISMFQRQFELVNGNRIVGKGELYTSARKKVNIGKNRKDALLPLDSYRVLLIPQPGVEGSDYINASWLPGYRAVREYILTQHPLENTRRHFWQLCSDHNVSTIVLLSCDKESEQFWPDNEEGDEILEIDHFKLKLLEPPSVTEDMKIVSLSLSSQEEDEVTISLLISTQWPNYNNSNNSSTFLFQLIQSVQEREPIGPMLVVDRFGGREGATFCLLSTICNQLDAEGSMDIYLYSKLFNDQRPGLWPNIEDYSYLYESIDELTKGRRNSQSALSSSVLQSLGPSSQLSPLSHEPPLPQPMLKSTFQIFENPILITTSPSPSVSQLHNDISLVVDKEEETEKTRLLEVEEKLIDTEQDETNVASGECVEKTSENEDANSLKVVENCSAAMIQTNDVVIPLESMNGVTEGVDNEHCELETEKLKIDQERQRQDMNAQKCGIEKNGDIRKEGLLISIIDDEVEKIPEKNVFSNVQNETVIFSNE